MNRKIIVAVLLTGLIASGMPYVGERGRGNRKGHGNHKDPLGHLMKCQKDNIHALAKSFSVFSI